MKEKKKNRGQYPVRLSHGAAHSKREATGSAPPQIQRGVSPRRILGSAVLESEPTESSSVPFYPLPRQLRSGGLCMLAASRSTYGSSRNLHWKRNRSAPRFQNMFRKRILMRGASPRSIRRPGGG